MKTLFILFFLSSSSLFSRTTLTPSQPSGERGDVISIDLHFTSDSAEVVGAQFALEYDPAQMTVGEITKGSAITDHEVLTNREMGK